MSSPEIAADPRSVTLNCRRVFDYRHFDFWCCRLHGISAARRAVTYIWCMEHGAHICSQGRCALWLGLWFHSICWLIRTYATLRRYTPTLHSDATLGIECLSSPHAHQQHHHTKVTTRCR